jgi:ribonuclease HII
MLKIYFHKTLFEAGCDEAGRGCLAGPVFAAAVILPRITDTVTEKELKKQLRVLRKVNDSKQLTHEIRMELRPLIEQTAVAFAIEFCTVEEIDEINIMNASFKAMHKAISKLTPEPELLLIDGNRFIPYQSPCGKKIAHQCIVGGDAKYLSIACASILAKTYRDEYMLKLHEQFPYYGWNTNKGYATREHRYMIETHGICEHHRKSFTLFPSQLELEFNDEKELTK